MNEDSIYSGRVKEILNVGVVNDEPVMWVIEKEDCWWKEIEIRCFLNDEEEFLPDDYEYIGTVVISGVSYHYFVRYFIANECFVERDNKILKMWQNITPKAVALGAVA